MRAAASRPASSRTRTDETTYALASCSLRNLGSGHLQCVPRRTDVLRRVFVQKIGTVVGAVAATAMLLPSTRQVCKH